jgi:hypothetical protein
MSTEVVTRSGTELQVSEEFSERFPAIAPSAEFAELIEETLGDEGISIDVLPKIRVPSGGGTQWALTTNGEEVYVKEITGLMLLVDPQRAFWVDSEPSGKAPDCASRDGKTPISIGLFGSQGERANENPTGLCKDCPMAQAGSDPNQKNRGSACKDQRLIYIVREGEMYPSVLTVPPSGIRELTQFRMTLLNSKTPAYGAVVGISLEKAKNAAGIEFAKPHFRLIESLSQEELAASKEYHLYLKGMLAATKPSQVIEATTTGASTGGGLRIGDEGEESAA